MCARQCWGGINSISLRPNSEALATFFVDVMDVMDVMDTMDLRDNNENNKRNLSS